MSRYSEIHEGFLYHHYQDGDIVQIVRVDRIVEHEPDCKDYGRRFKVIGNDGDSLPMRVFELRALDDPRYERSCFSHKIELVNTLESEAMEL